MEYTSKLNSTQLCRLLHLNISKRIPAMEVMGEDLKVQVFALSHNVPNQAMSLLNEDIAIATEVVIEKPELVEIEKEVVIQKRFIMKEKILVPKQRVTFPSHRSLGGHTNLLTDENYRLVEIHNQDCEESCKMEIASQESVDSRMDISSQESSLSQMEYSSQEADTLIKPISNDCSPGEDIKDATCKAKLSKENGLSINEVEVLSTEEPSSEKCLLPENYAQIDKDNASNEKEEVLDENLFQDKCFKTYSEAESNVLKRKADNVILSAERSLLYREEAVAARETACVSREKAIKEREAALVSQGSSFLMAATQDSPSPKRLKLIGIFEC